VTSQTAAASGFSLPAAEAVAMVHAGSLARSDTETIKSKRSKRILSAVSLFAFQRPEMKVPREVELRPNPCAK